MRRKSLDGLRAVAFLSVFLFHLGKIPGYTRGPAFIYSNVIDWGFLGVDLFFVISGFIITALLLEEKARNRIVHRSGLILFAAALVATYILLGLTV